jgi:hypothetical protein
VIVEYFSVMQFLTERVSVGKVLCTGGSGMIEIVIIGNWLVIFQLSRKIEVDGQEPSENKFGHIRPKFKCNCGTQHKYVCHSKFKIVIKLDEK